MTRLTFIIIATNEVAACARQDGEMWAGTVCLKRNGRSLVSTAPIYLNADSAIAAMDDVIAAVRATAEGR